MYLISIACPDKTKKVTLKQLEHAIYSLSSEGIQLTNTVFSDHGLYRQNHVHGIAAYSGRYKHLTKINIRDTLTDEYIPFKVHYKRLNARFNVDDARNYIQRNQKPIGMQWEEEILEEAGERYLFV